MIDRRAFVAGAAAALVAAPRFARAQPAPGIPRIALVDRGVAVTDMTEDGEPVFAVLLNGLRELGYVEGETITIDRWSGQGQTVEGISRMVNDVVESRPDVIFARGRRLILPFMAATKTIPIVGTGTFPLDINMARPGGNITGVTVTVGGLLHAKRLQFLRDMLPEVQRIAFLGPRLWWDDEALGGSVRLGAKQLGLTLVPIFVDIPVTEATIRLAVASIDVSSIGAIYISPSTLMIPHNATLADAIAAKHLPAMTAQVTAVRNGILMSYSAAPTERYHRVASHISRILKGADPGELPIEQPTKFDLVINLKTAREIGITVPTHLLLTATEVIE